MPDPNYSNYTDDPEAAAPQEQQDDSGDDSKTALVPKAFCPRAKVGDEITARVVAAHEGEFELEYVDSSHSEPEPTEPESEEPSDQDDMAEMMG